jgi:hypothetical protein
MLVQCGDCTSIRSADQSVRALLLGPETAPASVVPIKAYERCFSYVVRLFFIWLQLKRAQALDFRRAMLLSIFRLADAETLYYHAMASECREDQGRAAQNILKSIIHEM